MKRLSVALCAFVLILPQTGAASAADVRGHVRFDGAEGSVVTGPRVSTHDGDIEFVVRVAVDEWEGAQQRIVASYDGSRLLNAIAVTKRGGLTLEVRDRSGDTHRFASRDLGLDPGQAIWVRVQLDVFEGRGSSVRFWVTTDDIDPLADSDWSEPFDIVTGERVAVDKTAGTWVLGEGLTGEISYVRVVPWTWETNGGDPAIALDFDTSPIAGSGGRQWSDVAGMWTLEGSTSYVGSAAAPQRGPVLERYDAAKLAGVANGLSGMWVSHINPGVHWFVLDHDSLNPGRYSVFAIDAVDGRLVWRGKLAKGGSSIRSWADVEDLTGVYRDGQWYLAIWDNGNDSVYEIPEPQISVGADLVSVPGIVPMRITEMSGGQPGSGNVESMAWSAAEDAMYWIGPRMGGWALDDNKRGLYRTQAWSGVGSAASAGKVGDLITRPIGTAVPNANGAMDISVDGNTMVVQGVSTNGDLRNSYVMVHRKSNGESWAHRLTAHPQPTIGESVKALTPGENVALDFNGDHVFSAGEGNAGTLWSTVIRLRLP